MRNLPGITFILLAAAACATAQTATDNTTFYTLGDTSTYTTGCFDRCDCPILGPVPMRGTFLLTLESTDPLFTNYSVSQVNWRVRFGDSVRSLTGSGAYRIGGEVALQHQLTLDLITDAGPPQHFDSGLVPVSSTFPAIDITASINNQSQCHDTLLEIHARPASTVYRLGRESLYLRGCFGPCLCPVILQQPIAGTFRLHRKGFDGLFSYFGITDVNWKVDGLNLHLTGTGSYRVGGEFAIQHQLVLDLSANGGPIEHFDSGLVQGGGEFPAINIDVFHGEHCLDTMIRVQARPAGDLDLDGDTDAGDADALKACQTRAGVSQSAPGCQAMDQDGDSDVDLSDFGLLQRCMVGDGIATALLCAQSP
jgi:hypothetical protein